MITNRFLLYMLTSGARNKYIQTPITETCSCNSFEFYYRSFWWHNNEWWHLHSLKLKTWTPKLEIAYLKVLWGCQVLLQFQRLMRDLWNIEKIDTSFKGSILILKTLEISKNCTTQIVLACWFRHRRSVVVVSKEIQLFCLTYKNNK